MLFFSFFYFKSLVKPLFIQLFCNNIKVSSKNKGEDLMKTVQLLYNNDYINNFLYSRVQETKYLKLLIIYKSIYNRLYWFDKNI